MGDKAFDPSEVLEGWLFNNHKALQKNGLAANGAAVPGSESTNAVRIRNGEIIVTYAVGSHAPFEAETTVVRGETGPPISINKEKVTFPSDVTRALDLIVMGLRNGRYDAMTMKRRTDLFKVAHSLSSILPGLILISLVVHSLATGKISERGGTHLYRADHPIVFATYNLFFAILGLGCLAVGVASILPIRRRP